MPYIPHTDTNIREMLAAANVANLDDLFSSIPKELRLAKPLALPAPLSEIEATKLLSELAGQNTNLAQTPSFLGAGCYNHFIPAVVDHLSARSEFYTAYTPYQPETSQGALTTAFEYQTMMCQLTGMEVSNASLYDGATALAEAILMALHTTNKKQNDNTACVAYQSPNFFGIIEPVDEIVKLVRKQENTMVISVVNPMSLGLLKPPGEYGVDIVVGDAQPLGNRMSFGGPHLGFMATKMAHIRKMPGRIVGETTDAKGRRGFVLTLSTREQHIRREKATSNICSNQALCAIRTAIYLSAVGKTGLKQVAELNLQKAHYAADQISKIPGFKLLFNGPYFNEFVVECPKNPEQINKKLLKAGIIGGLALKRFYPKLKNSMLLCVTEMTTRQEIDNLVNILSKV